MTIGDDRIVRALCKIRTRRDVWIACGKRTIGDGSGRSGTIRNMPRIIGNR